MRHPHESNITPPDNELAGASETSRVDTPSHTHLSTAYTLPRPGDTFLYTQTTPRCWHPERVQLRGRPDLRFSVQVPERLLDAPRHEASAP